MNESIQNSTRNLAELEFLSGQLETMEEFSSLYEAMLHDCQETGDRSLARELQQILMSQVQYLMNAWLQGKKGAPEPERFTVMEYGKQN